MTLQHATTTNQISLPSEDAPVFRDVEYFTINSQTISSIEQRNIQDFTKYSEYIIQKYQKQQQSLDIIVDMIRELVALAENIFSQKIYKKYGYNKQMMVLDVCKRLYPGPAATQNIFETLIIEKIKYILQTNTKRELKAIFNNLVGIIGSASGCLRSCVW